MKLDVVVAVVLAVLMPACSVLTTRHPRAASAADLLLTVGTAIEVVPVASRPDPSCYCDDHDGAADLEVVEMAGASLLVVGAVLAVFALHDASWLGGDSVRYAPADN